MIHPVGDYRRPVGGEYAFGMELQAAQVQAAVPQAHHLPFRADGGTFQTRRQRGGIHDPGMVPAYGEYLRQAGEKVVVCGTAAGRLYAVEDFVQVHECAAESLSEGLLAEADAQDGLAHGVAADDFGHQPGFGRDAGPRREQQLVERLQGFGIEAVVAQDAGLRAQRFDEVHQIIERKLL